MKLSLEMVGAVVLVAAATAGCGGNFVDNPAVYSWVFQTNAPPDTRVTRSAYWQSGHFTREYSVFMEVAPGTSLVASLTNSMNLVSTNLPVDWKKPELAGNKAPTWFMPKAPSQYDAWIDTNYFRAHLVLARDRDSGVVFFCDQQL